MKLSRLFIACTLAWGCTSIPAQALTVGKLRGAALLGQALDVTIAVQWTAQEDVGGVCPHADVFYGDSPVDRSRIALQVESGDGVGESRLRIQASAVVDEPVVTLYVRVGCRQQNTRKYVMLADYASDVPVSAPVVGAKDTQALSGPGAAPSSAALPPGRSGGDAAVVPPALAREQLGARREARRISPPAGPVRPRVPPAPRSTPSAKGARLQLLPLELSEAWEPSLRFSDTASLLPAESDPRREQAAALWRALNATPQEVLRDSARVSALEQEVKALQAQSHRTQQSLVQLGMLVQRAHEGRYANPVLYALAGLLALVAAVGTYGWRRQRPAFQPWWMAQPGSEPASQDGPRVPSFGEPMVSPPPPPPAAPVSRSDLDLALVDVPHSASAEEAGFPSSSSPPSLPSEGASSGYSDFAHSVTGSLRAINTQEMVDVRQQADFFLALGQHDEAIRVLQNGIGQSGDSNPLVFLDLVAVLHSLGRKDEYEQVRTTFNELYTGHIPSFTDYSTLGDGLMAYPQVCERIARLWPTESGMEYIEHCLVRDITDTPDRGFELSAFRDLLMLHGIIGKIVVPGQQPGQHTAVERTLPLIAPTGAS